MNKAQLIRNVAFEEGLTVKAAESIVNEVLSQVVETVQSGETVDLAGFGKFEGTFSDERVGRNPQTGGTLTIPAKRGIKFKPSKTLKDLLNK